MLHKEAVDPKLVEVAERLCSIKELERCRIVGGTALSLQFGHRLSVDIDFFANEKIGKGLIGKAITQHFPGVDVVISDFNVTARINGVRVEIFDDWGEPYRHPPVVEEGLRLTALQDIAALKLTAFTERREKKDYIDLYFLFRKLGAMSLLKDYRNYNPNLSSKSLVFALEEVDTAEVNKSEMPVMLIPVEWKAIKEEMHTAAKQFKSYLVNKNSLRR